MSDTGLSGRDSNSDKSIGIFLFTTILGTALGPNQPSQSLITSIYWRGLEYITSRKGIRVVKHRQRSSSAFLPRREPPHRPLYTGYQGSFPESKGGRSVKFTNKFHLISRLSTDIALRLHLFYDLGVWWLDMGAILFLLVAATCISSLAAVAWK